MPAAPPGILTPGQTRSLLERLELRPRKALGQNFLIDGNLVRKSIAMAGIEPGNRVVEIGPGLGTLTRGLLAAGATVYAVERDPKLATFLREELRPVWPGHFHLNEGDAMDDPFAGLEEPPFRIVANLPYAISSPWLERVLNEPLPERMVLLIQKEAADRWTAPHGRKAYGALAIFLAAAFALTERHPVKRQAFFPSPEIDSVLIRLDRRPSPYLFSPEGREAIREAFGQRRKQLRQWASRDPRRLPWWESTCRALGDNLRPEQVPPEHWQNLDRSLQGSSRPAH